MASEAVKLSADEEKRLTEIFNSIDKDGNGALSKQECTSYWDDKFMAQKMVEDLDENADSKVTKDEWLDFFTKLKAAQEPDAFAKILAHVAKRGSDDD
uniref:EF-hand domain-containing protein n=1 Tax=Coccolithus braarudii TaxID=221442 RepID=A0A7S0Q0A1_9EUKA